MRTIGLIGGMSWESTLLYYSLLNREVQRRCGGHSSAICLLHSVNFAEIEALQRAGDWNEAGNRLADAALGLERAGADMLVLCTNTMHKVADRIQFATPKLPFLHIADATAAAIKARGLDRIALLGTAYTMEQDFYKGRLMEDHGLEVVVPNQADRDTVHRIIFEELCHGQVLDESRRAYMGIIGRLADEGAQGVILGCTEIGMLVRPEDTPLPLFDTTELHALAAVDRALE